MRPLRVFVTDLFLSPKGRERALLQEVLDLLTSLGVEVLTGTDASAPIASRTTRLGLLDSADAVIMLRTGPSERGAFEAAYNQFGGRHSPMFLGLWKHAPGHGTEWRDIFRPAACAAFSRAAELHTRLSAFLKKAAAESQGSEERMIRMMQSMVA